MENKIVLFKMKHSENEQKHSKKLEWFLRDFITSVGGCYYDDKIGEGIMSQYFRLDNNICIEQNIEIRQEDYLCRTYLSCTIDPCNKSHFTRCVCAANRINAKLDYGNFEINEKTGDIIYRTYYKPDNIVDFNALDKLMGYPRHVINRYGHLFVSTL